MSERTAERVTAVTPLFPYTYVAARLILVVSTLLLIAFICLGFAGWGPGHELVNSTHRALGWVDSVTELHLQ